MPNANLYDVAPTLNALKTQLKNNQEIQSTQYVAKNYKTESQINSLALLPKIVAGYRYTAITPDQSLTIPQYKQGTFTITATFDLLNIKNYFAKKRYSADAQKKLYRSQNTHKKLHYRT